MGRSMTLGKLQSAMILSGVLALTAAPAHAGGLTNGRIADTRQDVFNAAKDAQTVADIASYDDRIVVLGPTPPVNIPLEPLAPLVYPQGTQIVVAGNDQKLLPLFVFGGLAGLPLLFIDFGSGGGAPLISAPPGTPGTPSGPTGGGTTTPPDTPSGPTEGPTPPLQPAPPTAPAVPEPATWAMLLLGFLATGAAVRSGRRKGAATRTGTCVPVTI